MDAPLHPNNDPSNIEAAIASYRPNCLDPTLATQALPRLRELVRATKPRSLMDATCQLSSGCRFLADVSDGTSCDVDELLTEEQVSRWSYSWKASGRPGGTLSNHLGRLNRLLRAKAGHAAQPHTARQQRDRRTPHDIDDLFLLGHTLAATDPAAAASILAGAGAGVVVPEVVGVTCRTDGMALIGADMTMHEICESWQDLAKQLAGVTIDEEAWQRARNHASATAFGPLDYRRLRLTWVLTVLNRDEPLAATLATTGLGRTRLDGARAHLPELDAETVTDLLRG
jgi:hypothetical protein